MPGVTSPFVDFPMTPDIPLDFPLRQTDQQENENAGRAAFGSGLGEGWWELRQPGVPRLSCGLQTKAGPDLGARGSWNQTRVQSPGFPSLHRVAVGERLGSSELR